MGFLVTLLLITVLFLVLVAACLLIRARFQRDDLERIRDRARLRIIEGQLATMRAALRIGMAEAAAKRRMHEHEYTGWPS